MRLVVRPVLCRFPAEPCRVLESIGRWGSQASNDWELWAEETDRNRELVDQAAAAHSTDPEAAFRIYLEAAESGSVWSMQMVAWYYDMGVGVGSNFAQAQENYYRALCAESWMTTIRYARLLEKHGYHEHWEGVLEDGVRADFIPAFFWLAWFRYKQSKSRKTCREVRPMLEHAANQGHPGARLTLERWMLSGKFGLREMPRGFRLLLASIGKARTEPDAREATNEGDAPSSSEETSEKP